MPILSSSIRKKIFRYFKNRLGEENTRRIQYLPFTLTNKIRKPPYIKVSNCSYICGKGLFVNGWILTGSKKIESIEIAFSANRIIRIDQNMMRIPRLDIQSKYGLSENSLPGFIAYVPLSESSDDALLEPSVNRARVKVIFDDGTIRRLSLIHI